MSVHPQEVHNFIRGNVKGTTTKDLAKLVNDKFDTAFTESSMKSYKGNHKLKSETPKSRTPNQPTDRYPKEVQEFIAENHKGTSYASMAKMLNGKFNTDYTQRQIRGYYKNHSLRSGLDFRFSKGHVSPNKGKKGICAPGCEVGWFKKGSTPVNHKPVGSERIDVKQGYILIKTAEPNVYWPKHVVVWEEAHGKVPKGHVITFLDGDKQNVAIENLKLISLAENLELNRSKLRFADPELTQTGILITKVKIAGRRKAGGLQCEKTRPRTTEKYQARN